MDKCIDTMTNFELSKEIAEAMGWEVRIIDHLVCCRHNHGAWFGFSPLTSWADWGIVYEFMRGKGWKADYYESLAGDCDWGWYKEIPGPYYDYEVINNDLRRASVIAGLEALRGEKGD